MDQLSICKSQYIKVCLPVTSISEINKVYIYDINAENLYPQPLPLGKGQKEDKHLSKLLTALVVGFTSFAYLLRRVYLKFFPQGVNLVLTANKVWNENKATMLPWLPSQMKIKRLAKGLFVRQPLLKTSFLIQQVPWIKYLGSNILKINFAFLTLLLQGWVSRKD